MQICRAGWCPLWGAMIVSMQRPDENSSMSLCLSLIRRRRQSDNWDVSGDDVELRPARGDRGGRKGWNFKFDSRADLAVRMAAH